MKKIIQSFIFVFVLFLLLFPFKKSSVYAGPCVDDNDCGDEGCYVAGGCSPTQCALKTGYCDTNTGFCSSYDDCSCRDCNPTGDDDCSQPCGACFACGACASSATLPGDTALKESFTEANFGEPSEDELALCEASLVPTVSAGEDGLYDYERQDSLLTTSVENTMDWFKQNTSLFSIILVSVGLGGVSILLQSRK